jgi:hypothetical protein
LDLANKANKLLHGGIRQPASNWRLKSL